MYTYALLHIQGESRETAHKYARTQSYWSLEFLPVNFYQHNHDANNHQQVNEHKASKLIFLQQEGKVILFESTKHETMVG